MAFNHYLHWGISIVSIDRVCLEYDSDQRLVIQIDPTASDEQTDMFIEIMQKQLAKHNIFISANVNELRYHEQTMQLRTPLLNHRYILAELLLYVRSK